MVNEFVEAAGRLNETEVIGMGNEIGEDRSFTHTDIQSTDKTFLLLQHKDAQLTGRLTRLSALQRELFFLKTMTHVVPIVIVVQDDGGWCMVY